MTEHTTVSISKARAEQLRRLADSKGLKTTSLLAALIDRELEASGLDRRIPGFEIGYSIDGADRQIIVDIGNARIVASPRAIGDWAGFIEDAVAGRRDGGTLEDGAVLFAKRKGAGIVLDGVGVDRSKFTATMPRDIAQAIAAELREAVIEIEAA